MIPFKNENIYAKKIDANGKEEVSPFTRLNAQYMEVMATNPLFYQSRFSPLSLISHA